MTFTVGKDGKIVDNDLGAKNKLGGVRVLTPTKVGGEADGVWNKTAWQTDAFYGNPLAGFAYFQ